jgi:hypothetical protein
VVCGEVEEGKGRAREIEARGRKINDFLTNFENTIITSNAFEDTSGHAVARV